MRRFFKKFFLSCALNIFAGIFVGVVCFNQKIDFSSLLTIYKSIVDYNNNNILVTIILISSSLIFINYFIPILSILKVGIYPYAYNLVWFVTPSERKNNRRLMTAIKNQIKVSKVIDLVLINGKTFYETPSPTNSCLLETLKTRISENQSPEIKIYLLNPNSAYLEKRAEERWNQKPTEKNGYINSHKTNIGNFIRDFGEQRIFFYNFPPIFQLIHFCDYIYVSSYLSNHYGTETIQRGYKKIRNKKRWLREALSLLSTSKISKEIIDYDNNEFDSFSKYLNEIQRVSISAVDYTPKFWTN